ncbi:threonine aldolase family protein [Cysteiniphilum halobium]|uniref:threonine aldolase family protein n=1 Tax=Cysteiniphilum halobium TaxID=2219059 RepID=UPI0013C2A268|nr:beta-eliminating lyase-related protein [Cysteiniphilum halobium]
MENALKQSCSINLTPFYHALSPEEIFKKMSDYCRKYNVDYDVYGNGEFLQKFEQKVAKLFGFESAVFVASGIMAQSVALKIACETKNKQNNLVAAHPSSHILTDECQNFQFEQIFKVLPMGDPYKIPLLEDFSVYPEPLSVIFYELPMRRLGGQLPSWNALTKIKNYANKQNIHLHLDGARIFWAQPFYQKSYQEIAQGFDSAYVSTYKGIGGLNGAILLGKNTFINRAKVMITRQGGRAFCKIADIVSGAMHFDRVINEVMPACFKKTQKVYELLSQFNNIRLNPSTPQSSMLHVHLPYGVDKANARRDKIAKELGVWIFELCRPSLIQNSSYFELPIGENCLSCEDHIWVSVFSILNEI